MTLFVWKEMNVCICIVASQKLIINKCTLIDLLLSFWSFYSEALHAWRTKARCNIVPAERLHELFEELEFNPTEKQSKSPTLTIYSSQIFKRHIFFVLNVL